VGFENLNVIEILRLGLSGLLFLFTVLAYRLINREQQRDGEPRRGILQTIFIFMGINFLAGVLVAAAGYFGGHSEPALDQDRLTSETYLVDFTAYLIDLTQWTEASHGPVVLTRTDYVRKVSDTTDDYIIPYFTTGDRIDCKPIRYSSEPRFVGPKNVFVSRKRGDEAAQPINDDFPIMLDGGRVVQWVGIDQKGNSRIHFDWDW